MKLEDFGKIKNRLKKEYNKNIDKVKDLNSKIKILQNNNKNESRKGSGWVSLFIFMIFLIFIDNDFFLIGVVPVEVISVSIGALSLIVGSLLVKITGDHQKELREFSGAKTDVELIEQRLGYEMEKKKLKDSNKVLRAMIDDLNENEELLDIVSDNYYLVEKKRPKSIDELKESIKTQDRLLMQKEFELDELIMKYILKENFSNVKFSKSFFCFSGLAIQVYYNNLLCNLLGKLSDKWYNYIFSFVVGAIAYSCYNFKERQDTVKAIGKFDSTFLSQTADEDVDYEREIDKVLDEIFEIRMEMEDEKLKLETKQKVKDFESKKNGNNFSYSYNPNNLREFDSGSIHQKSHESHLTKKRVKEDNVKNT